ncbi:MAG: hypothetical protein DHS20C18_10790 [Saprospiraceae bacterium]|nr:MAG: hypothetical protein DHS20C18_10790 [Saprospiraceae bacterium]
MSLMEVTKWLSRLEEELTVLKDVVSKITSAEKGESGSAFRSLYLERLLIQNDGDTAATLQMRKTDRGFTPVLALNTSRGVTLRIETDQAIEIRGEKYLHFISASTLFECDSVVVEGDLAAKLKYSKPFVWRKGQGRLRLYHSTKGFAILTKVVGSSPSANNIYAHVYVDPKDHYWYLEGLSGLEELEALFVGKF